MRKKKCQKGKCIPKKTTTGLWFCSICTYSTSPKFKFGDRGIWHKPAEITLKIKAQDIPCIILEQTKEGTLYLFTDRPIRKGFDNLMWRTATILSSDFTPI